jgi:hypothetical protein
MTYVINYSLEGLEVEIEKSDQIMSNIQILAVIEV